MEKVPKVSVPIMQQTYQGPESEGESDSNLRHSFDCTDIIEQVISRTTAEQNKSIKMIADSVEKQRQDLSKMVEAIIGLTSALITMIRVRQTARSTITIVSNEKSQGKSKWLQCSFENSATNKNGSNAHTRTRPRTDYEISLNASNFWFENNTNDTHH